MGATPTDPEVDRETNVTLSVAVASGAIAFVLIHALTDWAGGFAFWLAFLTGFLVLWAGIVLESLMPTRRAAAAEERQRQLAEQQERFQQAAEAKAREREERFAAAEAAYPIGSDEWKLARFKRHRYTVYKQTGVRWRRELYVTAGTIHEKRARDLIKELQAADRRLVSEHKASSAQRQWKKFTRSTGISSWHDAEAFVAGWLNASIPGGARLTGAGADGGIDVVGDKVAVQVKYYPKRAVGRPAVQQLAGAAGDLQPVFFTYAGASYTSAAIDWADEHEVALLTYGDNGQVDSVNDVGAAFLAAVRLHGT